MWTAFETMAGDVWEQALNASPENLATLKGATGQGKSISPDIIRLHGFDLRQKMGTILRSKYPMSGLSEIRHAYNHAFDADAHAIISAIDDSALKKLSAVRNVIVHKAGKVDQEYLDRTENIGDLPAVTLGQSLPLNGQFVADLLRSATAACVMLLKSVDEWIDTHKDTAT